MGLHLVKLAVGAESVDRLRAWCVREAAPRTEGGRAGVAITTRMAPRRVDELLAGGSLYWVVKGAIQARQRLLAVEPFRDAAGVKRYHLVLDPEVVGVRGRPCRPFQGWRYLRAQDAPADLAAEDVDETMPAAMRRDLMELCLI